MGAESALVGTAMTTGSRSPATLCSTSCMRAKPCDDVAVKVLAPVAEAPRTADKAECSDSTFMSSASSLPSTTNSESFSTIVVCGVIGYAAITSTSHCLTAQATAWFDVRAIIEHVI